MQKNQPKLIGPFKQIVTMENLPLKGPLDDRDLVILDNAGIVVKNGFIVETGPYKKLLKKSSWQKGKTLEEIDQPMVCLPGFVDAHTHMCFAGSRARDYSLRIAGTSYQEIAKQGGGILETVTKTRQASLDELTNSLFLRCSRHLNEGVTTCEVKSGYCLNRDGELKMLQAIREVNRRHKIDLVSTCLAAHVPPKDFVGTTIEYLELIINDLLPILKEQGLSNRVDIFIEENAFSTVEAQFYLGKAGEMGFSITVHGDQFTPGGSSIATEFNALSVDHLEASSDREIKALAQSHVIGIVLPGASIGLGLPYAPTRKLLDAGVAVAIASDWNPGSAPMGDLLLQAALLGASEKLTTAETLVGITFRAAAALDLYDRGIIAEYYQADLNGFPCEDFREILYNQGKLKPVTVWKKGKRIQNN